MDFRSWNFAWALCFAMEAFLATIGNVLTIIIFQKKQLRRRPHFPLISLAVADLLVGLVSIPLYIADNYVENQILFRAFVRVGNMLPGFASIFYHGYNCFGANVRHWLAVSSPPPEN